MVPEAIMAEAAALLSACREAGVRLVTAESCTGGLLAAVLSASPGASDMLERGFVPYSNAAKQEMLGVPGALIAAEGAVSEAVARAMAEGALAHARGDLALAITGLAGPGGGTADKPVGLVCFGLARRGVATRSERVVFDGDRAAVRGAAVAHALGMIRAAVG